jgi:hypothetical protein
MMDADILIHEPATLWNMVSALEEDGVATVAVDLPCKDVSFKGRPSFRERMSLNAASITRAAEAQLCAQLYCIRAQMARNIYLPKDLPACEDGFIKALVCSDFLEHPPLAARIRLAKKAAHTFEAYTTVSALLKNQKRQVLGQTVVHILVDKFLKELTPDERRSMASTLQGLDAHHPGWLKKMIAEHVARTRWFWRICPGYVGVALRRWRRLSFWPRFASFPAAVAHSALAMTASYFAYQALKRGCTDYWPRAGRQGACTAAVAPPVPMVRQAVTSRNS